MKSIEKFEEWKRKVTDRSVLRQLEKMEGDPVAIENAFYKDLEFGTGGMRGILGAGTNCLNIYNIRKVTEGVSRYMEATDKTSVAISHDSRHMSKRFAKTAAEVFASHGIRVHIVPEESPTPFLSYSVRRLGCDMGVMVTASHNPKQYNGYKLYDETGCQVLDDAAEYIIEYVEKVDPFEVHTRSFAYYERKGLISYIDRWVYSSFLCEVETQALNDAKPLRIVYTPLNGAGFRLVPEALHDRGFNDVSVVDEQAYPDGDFKTCPFPNPEKPEALALAIKKAEKEGADLVLATDPDCDRVGIAVRHNGEFVLLTGNEVGVLLTDYILGTRYARWSLPYGATVVRTIVTTSLVDKIAAHFGVKVIPVLTGFKWIGNVINKLGDNGGNADRFVIGFEESYGYLIGTHCRDKDAVVASVMIAEMTAYYKSIGRTLIDQLNGIYAMYGKYEHKNISKKYEGAEGNKKMRGLMESLRTQPITSIGGGKVVRTVDFLDQTEYDVPRSDVMLYETDNGLTVIVRPSGTEPLIKFYITAAKSEEENAALFAAAISDIDRRFA
ncbi:MAG TPA: phospho-sugar mutase [Firmicutes bacterium]|nr:phospho-sugar mutase [Bacillota bacterium]